MLKIKNIVNLKELEKFGLVENKYGSWLYEIPSDDPYFVSYLVVSADYEIGIYQGEEEAEIPDKLLDILFDLIQAGLVEKVSGE